MWKSQRGGDRKSGKTYGPNRRKHLIECVWCQKQFRSSRSDAKYHSPSCRKKASRHFSEMDKIIETALAPKPKKKRTMKARPKKKARKK